MRKSFVLFVVSLFVCGAAIAGQTGVMGAQSFRTEGEFDRSAFEAEQQRLMAWLVAEQVEAGLAVPVSIKLTDEELQEIELGRNVGRESAASALLVGMVKPVTMTFDLTAQSHGAAAPTADGGFVWSAAIHSDFAAGLRVHFTDFFLPRGYELWLYSMDGVVRGPYTGRGPLDSGEFWSHTVKGPTAVLQLRATGFAIAQRAASFKVSDLAHEGRNLYLKEFCTYNADCVENGDCFNVSAVSDAKNAVALMRYVDRRRTYICSGGLVNSTVNPGTPYFLTANHCIDRDRAAVTLETWFNFIHDCDSTESCPEQWAWTNPATLGATVVVTNPTSDFTLLQLSEDPPGGAVFLGWTDEAVAVDNGAHLYRISHPAGAPQAYSSHDVDSSAGTCSSWPRGDWIYSRDIVGATEGGSSGSPVLNASGQVVGQLSGACGTNLNDNCDAVSNATVDGAFAAYYDQVAPYLGTGEPPCTTDADGDGYADAACGGTDCNDAVASINPGATEVCNGVDDNCDGTVDEGCGCTDDDNDGFCIPEDCDDSDPDINPDATEICDDLADNDCNGLIDGNDPACTLTCGETGDPCQTGTDCCSLRCHPRRLTCK